MSTKYVRELLESVDLLNPERAYERIGEALQELRQVEAARAKDAELIQQLVDDLRLLRIEFGNRVGQTTEIGIASLSAAEADGFKPSDSSN
jgi:hypothetical protein